MGSFKYFFIKLYYFDAKLWRETYISFLAQKR